jgi:hypothetical protein
MTHPDFHELVGDDLSADEETRLRRAHEMLLQAGPLPEIPPGLAEPSTESSSARRDADEGFSVFQLFPRRRAGAGLALAAAIAMVAFLGGYVTGFRHNAFTSQYAVAMHAPTGAATAEIKIGKHDKLGNWPMEVEVSNLPKLHGGAYYEMFLTRGKRWLTCGTFAAGGAKTSTVRLNAPYEFHHGDGWVVTVHRPGQSGRGQTVLSTA